VYRDTEEEEENDHDENNSYEEDGSIVIEDPNGVDSEEDFLVSEQISDLQLKLG
jgi:hypothetical protein